MSERAGPHTDRQQSPQRRRTSQRLSERAGLHTDRQQSPQRRRTSQRLSERAGLHTDRLRLPSSSSKIDVKKIEPSHCPCQQAQSKNSQTKRTRLGPSEIVPTHKVLRYDLWAYNTCPKMAGAQGPGPGPGRLGEAREGPGSSHWALSWAPGPL